jgi:molybdate transport system ATP-binding protein
MIEVDIEKRLGAFDLVAKFTAPSSGITALFGRSGAGKTTIINALAGLVRPDRGRIAVGGEVLFSATEGIDRPPERRRLGYVFQESRLFPHYSVRGNLTYGMRRAVARDASLSLDAVVDLLKLSPLMARRPLDLSGGEKQRVAIGRALLADPRLLLMDEPLASLDLAHRAEILPFIDRLRDRLRIPIVYVTHAMEEIVRLADILILVSDGKVAAQGTVEEITGRLDLRPLTGRFDAGAVIRASVAGNDLTFGLSELAFPGGRLRVPHLGLPLGTPIRARIRARDVALALEPPKGISVLNVFAGEVVEIAADQSPFVDVRLDIGKPGRPVVLWARVTRRSAHELALSTGKRVHALVKSVALDRMSFSPYDPAHPTLLPRDADG